MNAHNILLECKRDLIMLEIEFGKNILIIEQGEMGTKLGDCTRNDSLDLFIIRINKNLFNNGAPFQLVKTVVMHELLHTVDGCFNHDEKWCDLANRANFVFDLNIEALTDRLSVIDYIDFFADSDNEHINIFEFETIDAKQCLTK